MSPILRAENLVCARAQAGGGPPVRLDRISLTLEAQTICVIRGEEGAGRSLLLRCLGLLEVPDSGELFVHGGPTRRLDATVRIGVRNQHFGFMFADPFLLPAFSAAENVAMPWLKVSGRSAAEARERTEALLDFVGLRGRAEETGEHLSLADRHRVSLARALINHPEILVADNLDTDLDDDEFRGLAETMQRAVEEFHVAVLLSTVRGGPGPGRVIELAGGAIASDSAVAQSH